MLAGLASRIEASHLHQMADTSESAAAALQNSATTEVNRKTPVLSEEEIDDLIYFARAGEDADLSQVLKELAAREDVSISSILEAAKDEGKATCLHMAAANGHSSKSSYFEGLMRICEIWCINTGTVNGRPIFRFTI